MPLPFTNRLNNLIATTYRSASWSLSSLNRQRRPRVFFAAVKPAFVTELLPIYRAMGDGWERQFILHETARHVITRFERDGIAFELVPVFQPRLRSGDYDICFWPTCHATPDYYPKRRVQVFRDHGPVTKGGWTKWAQTLQRFTHLMLGSHYHADLVAKLGVDESRIHITGWPKLDYYFNTRQFPREGLARLGLDPNLQTVLITPTMPGPWSMPVELMLDAAKQAQQLGVNVIYKLHDEFILQAPEIVTAIESLVRQSRTIRLADHWDSAEWIGLADVVVSDASSITLEAMAARKDLVLVPSRDSRLHEHIEQIQLRKGGFCAYDGGGIGASIRHALENPGTLVAHQREVLGFFNHACDGQAANRTVAFLGEIITQLGLSKS
jgi:CDP-Glycerol:Poly(glycerophosphate) glycerophosphotransferase